MTMKAKVMASWVILPLIFFTVPPSLAIDRCSRTLKYMDLCPSPLTAMSLLTGGGDRDMSIPLNKEQLNESCSFFKGNQEQEVVVVGGIHLTNVPFTFYKAESCSYYVKFVLESRSYMLWDNHPVCRKELGITVHKENVIFWHNISLTSNTFEVNDLILNYGHSPSDLICNHNHKGEYVLMFFLTSVDSECSLIIQQYKVNTQGHNCPFAKPKEPRFCGKYPCNMLTTLLQELKLVRRVSNNYPQPEPEQVTITPDPDPDEGQGQEEQKKKKIKIFVEPQTTPEPSERTLGPPTSRPITAGEWTARLSAPLIGVCFLLCIFCILKQRYADEICGPQGCQSSQGCNFGVHHFRNKNRLQI